MISLRRMHIGLAVGVASAFLMPANAAFAQTSTAVAQPRTAPRHMAVQDVRLPDRQATLQRFMAQVNGTWVLERRTNADGSEHRPAVRGVTKINLKLERSTLLGTMAAGTISAVETGVLDPRWGVTVPPESRNQPFRTESVGSWQVWVDPEDKDANMVTVVDNSTVLANYRPFQRGLRGEAVSKFRVAPYGRTTLPTRIQARSLRQRGQPPAQSLVSLASEAVSRIAPTTLRGDPIPESDLLLMMCVCTELLVGNDVMKVTWSNGATDVWVRTSAQV